MAKKQNEPDVFSREYLTEKAYPSLKKTAKETYEGLAGIVTDPIGAINYASDLASGLLSKGVREVGQTRERLTGRETRGPTAAEARKEAALDTAVRTFVNPYTTVNPQTGEREVDMGKIRDVAYNDPFKFAADASMFVAPAGSGIRRAGMLVESRAPGLSNALINVGKAVEYTSAGMVPQVTAPVAAAVGVAKTLKPIVQEVTSVPGKYREISSGVPDVLFKTARQAGRTEGIPAAPGMESGAEVFNRYRSGQGDIGDIRAELDRALNKVQERARQNHVQQKAGLSTQPVDLQNVMNVLDKLDADIRSGSSYLGADSINLIQQLKTGVNEIAFRPDPAGKNINAVDRLKQQIGQLNRSMPDQTGIITPVYQAVRQAIADVDPDYLKVMEQYQDALQLSNDLSKAFGAGQKRAASMQVLAKSLRSLKSPAGQDLFSELTAESPNLPFMMAGEVARSPLPEGSLERAVTGAVGIGGGIGAYFNPYALLGIPVQMAVSSPRVMSNLEYGLGKVSGAGERAAQKIGQYVPEPVKTGAEMVGTGVGKIGSTAKAAADIVAPSVKLPLVGSTPVAATQLASEFGQAKQTQPLSLEQAGFKPEFFEGQEAVSGPAISNKPITIEEFMKMSEPATQEQETIAPEDRAGRATGGRVESVDGLVDQLMMRVRKAKKETTKATEPLLNQPDEHIVRALDIAQQAI